MSTNLSVIIITKNEENNIRQCLESVKWIDEIIVFDSGSTDKTVEICKQYTPHVFLTDWPGFGIQKNRALDKATKPWVLSIDADEFLSPELTEKIKEIIQDPQAKQIYKIKRVTKFCGKYLYYGDWRNDMPLRLFQRGKTRFKEVPIHESLIVGSDVGKINQVLWHNSFENLEDVIQKMNAYSSWGAENIIGKGEKPSLLKAILRAKWTFLRGYVFRGGFLDGRYGFLLAICNAVGCFYKYAKASFQNMN